MKTERAKSMKIKMDKTYTPNEFRDQVKGDMISFKNCFTDNDLYRLFCEQLDISADCEEVLKCEVSAFPSGWACGNNTVFQVELVAHGFGKYVEIRYYCDSFGTVDTRDTMFGDKLFKMTTYKMM